MVKNLLVMQETQVQSPGWEDPLEEGMATRILAWRIPMNTGAWWATDHGGHKESDMTEPFSTSTTTGGPVVKTPSFHFRRHRFNPWWEN